MQKLAFQFVLAMGLITGNNVPADAQRPASKVAAVSKRAVQKTPPPRIQTPDPDDIQNRVCKLPNGNIGYILNGDPQSLNPAGLNAIKDVATAQAVQGEEAARQALKYEDQLRQVGLTSMTARSIAENHLKEALEAKKNHDPSRSADAHASLEKAALEEVERGTPFECPERTLEIDTRVRWPKSNPKRPTLNPN